MAPRNYDGLPRAISADCGLPEGVWCVKLYGSVHVHRRRAEVTVRLQRMSLASRGRASVWYTPTELGYGVTGWIDVKDDHVDPQTGEVKKIKR